MQRHPCSLLGATALGALALACGGLDAADFAPPRAQARGGQAGFSYDAGVGAGGKVARAGSAGQAGRASIQPPPIDDPEGGAGGMPDGDGGSPLESAGASGESAEPVSGGRAGMSGFGGRASGGTSGLGTAGAFAWGGRGGAAAAGAGGVAGHATSGSAGALSQAGHGGASGGTAGSASAEHALLFSEYVEGSGSYKALEIHALRASSLAGCRLVTYFNGASSGTGVALDGELPADDVYVLCSSSLATAVGTVCDRTTNLSFNGDDAIALECDGLPLDVIGQIGVDPDTAWEANGAATINQTLRRRCPANAGDPDGADPFDPSAAWLALPEDSFDGLGKPDCG